LTWYIKNKQSTKMVKISNKKITKGGVSMEIFVPKILWPKMYSYGVRNWNFWEKLNFQQNYAYKGLNLRGYKSFGKDHYLINILNTLCVPSLWKVIAMSPLRSRLVHRNCPIWFFKDKVLSKYMAWITSQIFKAIGQYIYTSICSLLNKKYMVPM
jgi:hypothetical protein